MSPIVQSDHETASLDRRDLQATLLGFGMGVEIFGFIVWLITLSAWAWAGLIVGFLICGLSQSSTLLSALAARCSCVAKR